MKRRLGAGGLAAALVAVVLTAAPASAASGEWTIDLFCEDGDSGPKDQLRISFSFDALPAHATGAVAGRHDYGVGQFDYVQASSSLSADASGHTERTYETPAANLSFGAYKPTPGDEFAWRVVLDGHGEVLTGTTFVGGSGCSAASVTAVTPTISGQAKVGKALAVATGTWLPAPVALTRQWYADGAAIPGATGPALAVQPAHLGRRISVRVTGSKAGYTTVTRTSAATPPVVAGTLSPAPKPKISGKAKVGKKLTAKPGSWGPGAVVKSYRWYAGGKAIKGAKSAKLKLKPAHVGKRITVKVTGTRPGYAKLTRTSAPTKKVKP